MNPKSYTLNPKIEGLQGFSASNIKTVHTWARMVSNRTSCRMFRKDRQFRLYSLIKACWPSRYNSGCQRVPLAGTPDLGPEFHLGPQTMQTNCFFYLGLGLWATHLPTFEVQVYITLNPKPSTLNPTRKKLEHLRPRRGNAPAKCSAWQPPSMNGV